MGLTLYEIDAKLQAALELADNEAEQNEGIIPENLAAELDALEMEREQKAVNVCRFIKNLSAEAVALDIESDRLHKRAKSAYNRIDFLKRWLCAIMPGWKYRDETCVVSWRKSKRVDITDSEKIPADYKREVTEIKIIKTDIKQAIESGKEVPGAAIVENQNIQIK